MFFLASGNKCQWWAGEFGRNKKSYKNREQLELSTISQWEKRIQLLEVDMNN